LGDFLTNPSGHPVRGTHQNFKRLSQKVGPQQPLQSRANTENAVTFSVTKRFYAKNAKMPKIAQSIAQPIYLIKFETKKFAEIWPKGIIFFNAKMAKSRPIRTS
jgi:hypothetical protein